MEKLDRVLFFWAFNPIHNGHLAVLDILESVSRRVDIYIGRREQSKKGIGRLPFEIRTASVQQVINTRQNCSLVTAEKMRDIDPALYSAIAFWSDLLSIGFNSGKPDKPSSTEQWTYFNQFRKALVFKREWFTFGPEEEQLVQTLQNSQIFNSWSPLRARAIREKFLQTGDITDDLPPWVWNVVKDYIQVWQQNL